MKIKTSEVCAFIFIIMQGYLFGDATNNVLQLAGYNAWIVPILGSIIGFPIFLMYLYIFNYKKDMNINKLNIYLFGKFGKVINIVLAIYIGILSMGLMFLLLDFIVSQYLYNTPQFFIQILFTFVIIFVIKSGISSFFKTLLIIAYFLILLYIVMSIGLIGHININNILPIFDGKMDLINSTFNYIMLIICPLFTLLIIPRNKVDGKKVNKKLIITYILTSLVCSFIIFLTVSIFGIKLCSLYQYPEYQVLKRAFSGSFIERLERALAVYWFFTIILAMTNFSLYFYKSFKDNFKVKKIHYILIVIFLCLSKYLFENNTQAKDFMISVFPTTIFVFLVGIPVIIFIRIKHKKGLSKQTT